MPIDSIATKLGKLKRELGREGQRRMAAALLRGSIKAFAITVLPFLVYVRACVYLYRHGANPWIAIIASAILTSGLVCGGIILTARHFRHRARVRMVVAWAVMPIVFTWCIYAAFYLSRVHVKSDAVRAYYSAVNPILRVALSTIVLVDPDLVVTDMGRVARDYRRMGLPVNDRTKHYRQADGWVHAVDLRTRDRWEIRNRALQLYFWSMGFDTLRHVGTADHLHVQLAIRP